MLTFANSEDSNIKILMLTGDFSADFNLGLEAILHDTNQAKIHHLVLNFSEIESIDKSGLGQLFIWYHNLRPQNVRISILNPPPNVRELLEATHMTELIPIYSTLHEATACSAPSASIIH
jgi:anti-anti-sigma factor